MHHFSEKNIAIIHVLVFTCLFILFALEKHKKSEGGGGEEKKKKSKKKPNLKSFHNDINSKNGLDKIIGTLNLIFGRSITS